MLSKLATFLCIHWFHTRHAMRMAVMEGYPFWPVLPGTREHSCLDFTGFITSSSTFCCCQCFRFLFSSGGHTRRSDGGVTSYLKNGVLFFDAGDNKINRHLWVGQGVGNCFDDWCHVAAVWHPTTGLQVSKRILLR